MSSVDLPRWPGQSSEAYPDLFTKPPAQPATRKPGQLNDQQLKQLFEDGFVQVDNFLRPEELEPAKQGLAGIVDDMARLLKEHGKIKDSHEDLGFFQRLSAIEKEFPGAAMLLHKMGTLPQSVKDLWTDERLVNVAEQVCGTSDLVLHPVWNMRTKVPNNTATTVPWHQDSAYLDNSSYGVYQITAWIPLLDSNAQNGCMQMMKGGHRTGRVATHTCCWRDTHYVELSEEEMQRTLDVDPQADIVTCEVPLGGVLFFANTIPHRSLPNKSQDIRWSLDLRWQRADKPVGFYGVKHGVRVRSSTDPDYKVNWEHFKGNDRFKLAETAKSGDLFNAQLTGWWMRKWEMTHPNTHTENLDQLPKAPYEIDPSTNIVVY